MAIDERARHGVHEGLAEMLGPERAADLMSMLVPHGWDDVATRQDIELSRHATRADLAELRGEMSQLREELRGEMSGLREELRGEMSGLREELRGEMSQLRTDLRGQMSQLRTDLQHSIDSAKFSILAWTVTLMATLNASLVVMVVALT
jgi:hypothetical protein